ncbi:Na/Pi cotransporter family protein [Pseudooceanicola algae]|uniref:Uncharacterized protein n=1 Tax=Pseudooceanicola algae TaxID=1537215 RepID=A0A418SHW0_9RHOB|nr:Na/Pi symporter [Pseudooceanicola algae]QPM90253.1 hypothetical protein PSAL_014880 [Pseudooceanicola algae]
MIELSALFLAGLSLFFTGVAGVKAQLQRMSGRRLRKMLSRTAGNPVLGTGLGIVAGAISQSASVVAFILSGMVATGLITVRRALLVVAASNIGTAVLVFLAAIDLRIAILYIIGLTGLAINFKVAIRLTTLFGALFSIGLLFFGLDMMKQGFAPLPQMPGFIALAAFLQDWDIAALILGAACRMFIQSSSAIGVIAITLQTGGIFTELQAMLLICGCGPGVALAGMFLSSNLSGAPRQIIIFQGMINFIAGAVIGGLLMVDNALDHGSLLGYLDLIANTPSQRVALLFLATMTTCWLAGLALLPWIEPLLNRIEPPTQTEDVSRTAYIHDEALEVPETATELAEREQLRLFNLMIQLLDCVRDDRTTGEYDDPEALHEGMQMLRPEIDAFIAELINRELDRETANEILGLERRQEHLDALEDSIAEFVAILRRNSFSGRAADLIDRLTESISVILLTTQDAWEHSDAFETETLMTLTADRGDMMERIRIAFQDGSRAGLEEESAIFHATMLFERIVWLVRQVGKSLSGSARHQIARDISATAAE